MKLRAESIKNRFKSYLSEIIKKIKIVHKLDYDKFPVYLNDNIRLASCKKEPDTVAWIETFKNDDVVFDIGANIGAYSLIMSKYSKSVFAFEPSAFTFAVLIKNIHTNKSFNIIPLNIALCESRKIGNFIYSSTELGSSSHTLGENAANEAYRQSILSYSIDEFMRDFKIPRVNHIKIDVDGTEFEILKGAKQTFLNNGFKTMLVEINNGQDNAIIEYLGALGLKVKEKYRAGEDNHNYLFIKK
jgi:FkbM family methyltransferase